MPYLLQKRIDGSVIQQWELPDKPLTFGRGTEADIQIIDDRMSRRHCAVQPRGEGFVVRDLGSTNGTWVNNKSITEHELKANDKIRIGQTVLVFVLEKPKGLATIMGEIEAEGKGLHTFLGELSEPEPPLPPPKR